MPARYPVLRTILADTTESSDAQTREVTLPSKGALHTLSVRCSMTNGSTGGRGVNMLNVIDLVEIIGDGNQVLYALNAIEIEKLHEIREGRALPFVEDQTADAVQRMQFTIQFGREFYDPELWLPLAKYNDLKLRIGYSPTIAADAGFATGTFALEVVGLVSDTQPSVYLGTIITRTIKSFTSAASGDENTDLHLANPLRGVMVYAYEAGIADAVDISTVVLRANDGEFDLFNDNFRTLQELNANIFAPKIFHAANLLLTTNEVWDTRMGLLDGVMINPLLTTVDANNEFDLVSVDTYVGDRITFSMADADITPGAETQAPTSVDREIRALAYSSVVGGAVLLPFDYDPDPATWLMSRELSRLELILTNAAAGAAVRISTQEVQRLG